jgi:hypothetical protein
MSYNGDTRISMSSEGGFHLKNAIEIATVYHNRAFSVPLFYSYAINKPVLYIAKDQLGTYQFPEPLDIDGLVTFILRWIHNEADFGPEEPGYCKKGWHLTNMTNYDGALFQVTPCWMEYDQ